MPPPPISILVVDDEPDLCEMSKAFLDKTGDIRAEIAFSVAEARAMLQRTHFDAIISDYQMPKEDGIEFLKSLRRKGDTIPFILFTGKGREEIVIEALNNGADSYLQKGGKPEPLYLELEHRVRMAVRKHQADHAIEMRNRELQRANEELAAAEEELKAQLDEILSSRTARAMAEERLRKTEGQKKGLFEGMMNGSAVHEIICDQEGRPVDYRFLELNQAFEALTGLRRDQAIGRTIKELIPSIEDEWIQRYGRVALTGIPEHFQNFAAGLGRYYEATAYQNAPGQFTVIFNDITTAVKNEQLMKTRLVISDYAATHTLDDVLRITLDEAEKITDSSIGFLHFVDPDQEHLHLQMWSTNTLSRMCSAEGKGQHYAISKAGVWVDCVRSRAPVIHNDLASLENRKGFPVGHAPVKRELVVPVMRGGKVAAVLGVGNKPTDYEQEDVRTVKELADLMWDIAERKRVEEELEYSRKRLHFALDNSDIGLWDYDLVNRQMRLDGDWIQSSSNAMVGIARARDREALRLIHPEDQEAAVEEMRRYMSGERPKFEHEMRMMRRDGKWRWLLFRGKISDWDEKGRPLTATGTYLDITERRHAEKVAHDAEDKYRIISESSPDHIVMMDRTLRYVWVLNPQLGLTEEEMIGKTDYELLSKEEADELTLVKSRVLGSGERLRFSTSLIARDGGREYFDGIFIPQVNEKGEAVGLMGYFRNVTENVRANDALYLANRKLNLLSSITRHDIINQILVLEGNLGFVEENVTDEAVKERLVRAFRAADRIADMIKFTKEYENIGITSPLWQDLHGMIETCADETNPGVRIVNATPKNIDVLADPLATKVFRNLIDNSIKHGGGVKNIHFSQKQTKDSLHIIYEDDGVGIPEDVRRNLFTRGYGKDHGLGLFLSRDILAITGISIQEEGEGKGARFVLTAPNGAWRIRK